MVALGAPAPGCSNHHVSPWGPGGPPSLSVFAVPPDLDRRLELVDREAESAGLTLTLERRRDLPRGGGSVVLRAYEGTDALGRPTHAVRVITTHGVVMAAGPLRAEDRVRRKATELLPAFAAGVLSDLNGDGDPDVVLRAEDGRLEIWRLGQTAAMRLEMELEVPPTDLEDIDGEGGLEVSGRAPLGSADPIGPELTDVGAFDGNRYSNRTPAAQRYHALRAQERMAMQAAARSAEERLRAAIERAWHEVLSGRDPEEVLERLDAQKVPSHLAEAFGDHRRRITRIGR